MGHGNSGKFNPAPIFIVPQNLKAFHETCYLSF